jgi:hypothetical protein
MVILNDRKDIKKENTRKKIFLFMNWEDNMKNHFDVCRNDDAVWRERQIDGKWMKKESKRRFEGWHVEESLTVCPFF